MGLVGFHQLSDGPGIASHVHGIGHDDLHVLGSCRTLRAFELAPRLGCYVYITPWLHSLRCPAPSSLGNAILSSASLIGVALQ